MIFQTRLIWPFRQSFKLCVIDFVAGDYSTTPEEEHMLKLKYIHVSANWNHPLGRKDGGGVKAVYINAPTPDGIRVQHPHVPDWTLF